jgi:arylsulfatase A-like enzyme
MMTQLPDDRNEALSHWTTRAWADSMDLRAGATRRDVGLDLAASGATMRELEHSASLPARLHHTTAMLLTLALAWPIRADEAPAAGDGPGAPRPNVVMIFVDNLGNGDLGCFGATRHRTPHIDRLAAAGTRFTSFYVSSGVCTPSRASLLTGCYPRRVSLHVSDTGGAVLQPAAAKGLNPEETTIAEVLGAAGYATACIGKWHLGDQPEFLPTRQGFDEFFGIPYSDDMTRDKRPDAWPELPLLRGERVVEAPVDRTFLVKRCTEEALAFIERNRAKGRPFFLYLPHTMPGSTLHPFASPAFQGRSKNGAYGDSVEELDWSTGEIMAALARSGLEPDTLVVWTSDNGAVRRNPPQGSGTPYRGYGYDTSEGAMRMPCIVRWPGKVPAGRVCDELWTTMDLLPTLAMLAGALLPARPIDGHDVRPILLDMPGARSPWDEEGFAYYYMEQLQAVRSGPWKLYLPLERKYVSLARKTAPARLELYDVRSDVGETREASGAHPEVVRRLLALADRLRAELGDGDRPGRGQRPAGQVEHPRPLTQPPTLIP